MKTVKIDFVDFWPGFDKTNNIFVNCIKKRYDVRFSANPDYVFCSCFSNMHFKYADSIKVFFTGENITPDFNLFDYAMGFNNIVFDDRYFRLPLYALYQDDFSLAMKKHTYSDEYYLSKKKFCNRVVSNSNSDPFRDEFFRELSKYKTVDSGGRLDNNVGGAVSDKIAFEKDYRFTLAFENSSSNGYITEKIIQAFAGDTIPIYWGDPNCINEFNSDSFVNCMEFSNVSDIINHIIKIWEDDNLYLEMIKSPIIKEGSLSSDFLNLECLEKFLYNIFDQELEVAKRRNMVHYGMDYQNRLAKSLRLFDFINSVAFWKK